MKKLLLLLIPLILLSLFTFYKNENKEISFYHWKNSFNIQNSEEKLYIKVLDIYYSHKLEFVKTNFIQKPPLNFVPTIYITNDTLKNIEYKKLSDFIIKNLKDFQFNELQIDCDWSLKSKSNYFNLLSDLKTKLNKTISATIRLHQIKYSEKTGVPPSDYGVLMYYNMSDITDLKTKNSILDNDIAKKYHYNFDSYKLKLKLALPLYSQAIRFRGYEALDIFEGVKKDDFKDGFEKLSNNTYKVTKSQYFQKKYVYKGDIFRFEQSKEKDLKTAMKDFFSLSTYYFDEIIFYRYEYRNKYDLKDLIKDTM